MLLVDPALDRTVTYAGFAGLVAGAADALRARGLEPGDRVALLARNGLEAAVAIWACARAGLVHLGLPPDGPAPVVDHLLDLTRPALVLAQPGLAGVLPAGQEPDDAAQVLLSAPTGAAPPHPADDGTTYMLIPTSGTTGRPKAVRVTGRMVGAAVVTYSRLLELGPEDRTAVHLPFGWVSGHVTQLAPTMRTGGSVVTMARFSAPELLDVCGQHGVTWLDVVPSIWELLLREPRFRGEDLPQVRAAVFGGAPAPQGTLERVRERLPAMRLHDVYAQSETCAPVTVLRDDEAPTHPGTVGRAVREVAVQVVDAAGAPLPPGRTGQVRLSTPAVSPGYWGSPEPLVGPDGWLTTQDLGRLDADGYLTLAGRADRLVIRGGVNVSLAAVEQALLGLPGVLEACAVGLPSRVGGERVAAAVLRAPGAAPQAAALRRAVSEHVGVPAVPRPLLVLDELPRGSNGKTDPAAVRALLARSTHG